MSRRGRLRYSVTIQKRRNVAAEVVNDISTKDAQPQDVMIPRRFASLLSMLCLLMAAAVALAQPVAVAGTHLDHHAELVSAILDHGHAHKGDLPDHDPTDHTHDVASEVQQTMVPMLSWAASWARDGSPRPVPDAASGHDRPPRQSVTT